MQPNASSLEAVVAGTDFSEPSDTAMSWAMLIAREHRAVLHVVHAVARTLPLVDHFDPLSPVGKLAAQLGQEQLVRLEETLS